MKKIIIILVLLSVALVGCSSKKIVPIEEAKVIAVDFINETLMPPGQEVSVKEVTEEGDLYKIVVNMPDGQELKSYITKDASVFFPYSMNIEEEKGKIVENKQKQEATQAKTLSEVPKQDKPVVDAFIMSHCPYGTQIEKGLIPVAKLLGDKIDFNIKFVNYAMHGEKEVVEQLNQYCIQKEEPAKFLKYLECFLADEKDGDKCIKEVGVSAWKMDQCVKVADKEFGIMASLADKASWKSGRFPAFNTHDSDNIKYGVQGSPTLVINETKIQSGRDAASLLKTICAAFTNEPSECLEELSATPPSAGFGWEGSGPTGNASCN